ncbi:OPT family small oligopeptide transporter [Gigaspora margarita]|uniref:OPT family small oligopeptide transporter n=1 Tax=Gigaspora margarita TaxID=4874 RepID=A0A8H4AU37_GIGMA|nr:OPT family small oligopeptide transporter [Gigaspora margarita]
MSQNKYLRLEENYSTEETEFELSELSNKSPDDDDDYGLRNRTSTGDLEDNEYLLDGRKTSIDSQISENSPIPMVAAAVSVKDDPSLPCTTFRFWVLSTLFTSLGAAVSEFYYFRSNGGGYSIFFVLLVSYIVGKWMARVLPVDEFKFYKWKFTLNPGPFNVKEHVLIAVAAGAGGGSAYGTDIIAIQDLFYNQHPGFFLGMLLLMSTQMIGYGLAGFLRKYLVRPANMLWPSNLVFSSLFSTLHGDVSDTRDKLKFFVATFTIMFVWQFLPQFMFPLLTSIALLCLIKPYNNDIVRMGSGYHGVGILNFSLDWNAIGQPGPLYTPWWAQVNWYVGVIVGAWIIAPILYYNDFWMAKKFPLLATYSLNKDGERYNQSAIIDFNTGSLNETAYKEYGPVYLSVTFAVGYFYSFIAFTAAITHVILFYGDEIWDRFKASRSEEVEDVHCKMMRNYEEIPNWWYACIFVFMLFIAILLCDASGSHLPWWGLLIAVGIACIMVLPVGVIQAVSNNQVGLNVITEMICGYIFPGLPIANVYFKCYGYMAMYQCLSFVSDLKLGHYMKIPPKAMFTAQMWGTVVGAFVNYWILQLIIYAKRPFLDGTMRDPTGQWTGYRSQVFNTASIIWGLIGPGRTFGSDSMYHPLLWGFPIGFLAPVPFYFLHKKFPKAKFNLVTIPLICNGLSILPGTYTNFIITGFIAAYLSQRWAYHRYPKWWKKYNYVLSAAFDSSSQIVTMVIFFLFNVLFNISFPEWWGNNLETQAERCFTSPTP